MTLLYDPTNSADDDQTSPAGQSANLIASSSAPLSPDPTNSADDDQKVSAGQSATSTPSSSAPLSDDPTNSADDDQHHPAGQSATRAPSSSAPLSHDPTNSADDDHVIAAGQSAKPWASSSAPLSDDPTNSADDDHRSYAGQSATPVTSSSAPLSDDDQERAAGQSATRSPSSSVIDTEILAAADALNDLEGVRRAAVERLRSLTHETVRGDKGGWYGKNLPDDHPAVEIQRALVADIEAVEKGMVKALEKTMKRHPLAPWVETTKGIGLKAIARLLATIGDPTDRPTIHNLYAFCGVGGPGYGRRKGVKSNWSNPARMRLYVVAEAAFRQGHYREVYVAGREKYEDRDTTKGHKHNMAMRLVMRAILKDLYHQAEMSS